MPSAILVQTPREDAELATPSLGVRILAVESAIQEISLTNSGGTTKERSAGQFDFDVDMSESSRTEDSLNVRYAFSFGKPSSGQLCKVRGSAVVRFLRFNPKNDFHALGNDISNEMAVEIFRKNYESVYLLLDALGMDAPTPWITQDVALSSRNN